MKWIHSLVDVRRAARRSSKRPSVPGRVRIPLYGGLRPVRYSDLSGKEIIDLDQGARLGVVRDTDLVIEPETGQVTAIVIPTGRGFWQRGELEIPFSGIVKIGIDLIIVDLGRVEARAKAPGSAPAGRFSDRPRRRRTP